MGLSSAANIKLFIYSEEIIEYIVNTFSTAEVYLIDIHKNISKVLNLKESVSVNDKFLKLEIPEIKQGRGSFVTLMTVGNQSFFPKNKEDNYQVYAIFNQGSTKGEIEKVPLSQQIDALRDFLYNYILNLYFLIPFYLVYTLFLIPYISLSRRKRKFQKHINDIIDDLIKFVNFYKEGKFEASSEWNELIRKKSLLEDIIRGKVTETEIEYEDLRNMLSVKDLSLIYTFYKQIEKHNLLYDKYNNIQNKIDSEKDIEIIKKQIEESYHDCFQYAKRILRELVWSNYKSSGISFVSS